MSYLQNVKILKSTKSLPAAKERAAVAIVESGKKLPAAFAKFLPEGYEAGSAATTTKKATAKKAPAKAKASAAKPKAKKEKKPKKPMLVDPSKNKRDPEIGDIVKMQPANNSTAAEAIVGLVTNVLIDHKGVEGSNWVAIKMQAEGDSEFQFTGKKGFKRFTKCEIVSTHQTLKRNKTIPSTKSSAAIAKAEERAAKQAAKAAAKEAKPKAAAVATKATKAKKDKKGKKKK